VIYTVNVKGVDIQVCKSELMAVHCLKNSRGRINNVNQIAEGRSSGQCTAGSLAPRLLGQCPLGSPASFPPDTILIRLLPDTCWAISTDPSPLLSIDFPCGPLSLPSYSYIAGCFRLVDQSVATCSRWFLTPGFFYPEGGGDTFLRNVGSHKIYTAPHPRRRHSSREILYFDCCRLLDINN
jgi:hypothetical protein